MTIRFSDITCRGALALAAALTLSNAAFAEDKVLKVGIMGGGDETVRATVALQAKTHGLTLHRVVFNDCTQPNEALQQGAIDANAFQHKPYLDAQIAAHGDIITPVGNTAIWPIGLYFKTYHKVADLPDGAIIGVPNDPSITGRAINLRQQQGLIKLKDGAGILATALDITVNPHDFDIKELEAGVVGRAIYDLDATILNTDWALKAGLSADTTDRLALVDEAQRLVCIAVAQGSCL